MNAYNLLDALVFSVMFFLFYMLFGKNSLRKFLKEETFTMEKKVDFDPENPPAITICATKLEMDGSKMLILKTTLKNSRKFVIQIILTML